jgi:serine/threonine protein kinase
MMRFLYHSIEQSTQTCSLTNKRYIPLDTLQEKITWPAVKKSLPDSDLESKVQVARRVIAIIILIFQSDAPNTVKKVLSEDLIDEDLPLSRSNELGNGDHTLSQKLQSHSGRKRFDAFMAWESYEVDLFLDKQWMFLEPQLKLDPSGMIDIRLESQCALEMAFSSCVEVSKTPHSTVYKGILRPGLQAGLGNRASSLRHLLHISADADINLQANAGNPGPVCIAVKIFNQRQIREFDQEKKVLSEIRSKGIKSDHLIVHLAVCDQVSCIVFPWAEGGDLWEFWQREGRSTPSHFLWALKQMAGLAQALEVLHSVNTRHGDLKPANILLYFNQTEGSILKIADLGIARGHNQATEFRRAGTITSASTQAYQGPEVDTKEEPRSRRYDCWSMGCIVLEFVVWLLYDFTAIESFWQARDTRTHAYYQSKSSYRRDAEPWEKAEVHPKVYEAMNCLRKDPRCRDTALKDLVDLVEDNLLKIHSQHRFNAFDLHQKLEAILQCAQDDESFLEKVIGNGTHVFPLIFNYPLSHEITETTFQQSLQPLKI